LALRRIKLSSVSVIEENAFYECWALEDVEFGDKLEIIGNNSFNDNNRLTTIKLPKVRVIGHYAFAACLKLTEVELPKDLETIGECAFSECPRLRRIAFPLKDNLLGDYVFDYCEDLSQVDLVGGIHKTISSFLLESWRNEMNDDIDRINQVLPNTLANDKTATIQQWMERVMRRIEHYKSEHYALLKEDMTQLELALWKANLNENGDEEISHHCALLKNDMTLLQLSYWKTKFDKELVVARQKSRVKCGANIIIPHVLSFLNDDGIFPLLHYDHQP